MRDPGPSGSGDVPTVLVRGSEGQDLLCFLEQLIPLDGQDYALLTPVDTPVSLFRLKDEGDPEPITTIKSSEPILSVADVVLQEHDLTLVRSAVTLTVSGELEEPDPDELEDDDGSHYLDFYVREKLTTYYTYGTGVPWYFSTVFLKDASNAYVTFSAPLPPDMKDALSQLRFG